MRQPIPVNKSVCNLSFSAIALKVNHYDFFALLRLVLFEVEGICFPKCFLKSLFSNIWHSFNSSEELIEVYSFLQYIRSFSLRCTHVPLKHASNSMQKQSKN